MGKRLDITPKIAASIARSTDGSVDPNDVAVFETISMNTLPIKKAGSIFNKAVASESLLRAMADYNNTPSGFVPLHNNHDQGEALPIGRVFEGQVRENENGSMELRSLFFLPLKEEILINKIETGVIEEVSVGVQPLHINCSECGFDYRGAEATMENLWTQTCANGHTVGVDGVRVGLVGLDRYFEQSLVSLGAANNAKIQPRTKALMGKDQYDQQLAATGIIPDATTLYASPTQKESMAMDLTQLVADLTTAKASNQVNEGALKAANETIATLTKTNEGLQAQIDVLKASADIKVPEVQAKLDAMTKTLDDAMQVMRVEADRLAVAASLDKATEGATIATLSETITAARTKLATSIPVGGVALRSEAGSGTKGSVAPVSSFKTR